MLVLSEFPEMEKGYSFTIPSVDLRDFMESKNFSVLITPSVEDEVLASQTEPDYEQFLADVWVGIVLTLMVLSCVCCMCSCLLYHKFQQWKRGVTEARAPATVESGFPEAELPSYTIASGLPSYEEALEQLKKVKELKTTRRNYTEDDSWVPRTPPTPVNVSVLNLFQIHRNSCPEIVVKL